MDELNPGTKTSDEEYITLTNAYETWFFTDYMNNTCDDSPTVQGMLEHKASINH